MALEVPVATKGAESQGDPVLVSDDHLRKLAVLQSARRRLQVQELLEEDDVRQISVGLPTPLAGVPALPLHQPFGIVESILRFINLRACPDLANHITVLLDGACFENLLSKQNNSLRLDHRPGIFVLYHASAYRISSHAAEFH